MVRLILVSVQHSVFGSTNLPDVEITTWSSATAFASAISEDGLLKESDTMDIIILHFMFHASKFAGFAC